MTTWYVDSNAVGTGAGTSWVNACTTMAAAIALAAAGDDFNVYSGHNETQASALILTFPGTSAAPNRIFSCDKINAPAQASDLVAGARITTTGSFNLSLAGTFYCYGVIFNCGTGVGTNNIVLANAAGNNQTFEACAFNLLSSSSSTMNLGNSPAGATQIRWINTTISFNTVGQSIRVTSCRFFWRNTASAILGAAVPNVLFTNNAGGSIVRLFGVDLSALGAGKTLLGTTGNSSFLFLFQECKLGASVTVAATPTGLAQSILDLINSDSTATGYRQERYWYQGTLTASTTVYNTTSDGVTSIAWKIVTTVNNNLTSPFETFDIVQWVAPGTYAASFINATSATAGLTNADIWAEAQVLDNASFPISDNYSGGPATQLTAGSALAAGSAWISPLGGSPNNYKLAIPSFTVAIAGYVYFRVRIATASLTVYVDPNVVVA